MESERANVSGEQLNSLISGTPPINTGLHLTVQLETRFI